jgi:hypothetical protein
LRFDGIPKTNLQENGHRRAKTLQIRLLKSQPIIHPIQRIQNSSRTTTELIAISTVRPNAPNAMHLARDL